MKKIIVFLLFIISCSVCFAGTKITKISLSGEWTVRLNSGDKSEHKITLPSTLDLAGIGNKNLLKAELKLADGSVNKEVMRHLTRKVSYVGEAVYEREIDIPQQMASRALQVLLERVLWKSRLYIDGIEIQGYQESLCTPHVFNLPKGLSKGKHTIQLSIDNSKQYDMSYEDMAHAYTNETQTMWNGVLGAMEIRIAPVINDIQVYPDVKNSNVKVVVSSTKKLKNLHFSVNFNITKATEINDSTFIIPIEDLNEWNEFTPYVYTLTVRTNNEERNVTFGMRNITSEHGYLELNGNRIFLRSTLECCIFPLTGCPPTTVREWRAVFNKVQSWGLNSLRFHSWCPPEAAFTAADEAGLYLQVELPNWSLNIEENPKTEAFLYREFNRIVKAYGNHPSFCLMTPGNEL